jgi:hypothetical protein
MSPLNNYSVDDIKSRFATVALDHTYQVEFQLISNIVTLAARENISQRFLTEDLGLYVSDAVLPGSSFADIEVAGDVQGITQRVPYSRIYDDITLTFMVDREYKVLKFFEVWNKAVAPQYVSALPEGNRVTRLSYPNSYKCPFTIYKFNKDRYSQINPGDFANSKKTVVEEYRIINGWPYSVASTPINYQGQNLLQLNVTFRYDRYEVRRMAEFTYDPEFNGRQEVQDVLTALTSDPLGLAGNNPFRDPNRFPALNQGNLGPNNPSPLN